jgi:hypothetical protein
MPTTSVSGTIRARISSAEETTSEGIFMSEWLTMWSAS